jgi:methionine-rich copper-binding protein CopC
MAGAPAYAINLVIINNNSNSNDVGPLRLVSVSPYNRQVVDEAPEQIKFTFSQPLTPDKSSIRVFDGLGHAVETGALESDGKSMWVAVSGLSHGKYVVKWRARCLCDDNAMLVDTSRFTVR